MTTANKNNDIDVIESGRFKLECLESSKIGEPNSSIVYTIKLRRNTEEDKNGFENLSYRDLEILRNMLDIILK